MGRRGTKRTKVPSPPPPEEEEEEEEEEPEIKEPEEEEDDDKTKSSSKSQGRKSKAKPKAKKAPPPPKASTSSSPPPPIPPRSKLKENKEHERLGLKLFKKRETDVLSDMIFLLPRASVVTAGEPSSGREREDEGGDEEEGVITLDDSDRDEDNNVEDIPSVLKVKAHMLIVREGSRTLEDMITRRVTTQGQGYGGQPIIKVPRGVDRTVFLEFLKVLYTEDLAPLQKLGEETIMSLLALADYFDVDHLYQFCVDTVKRKINQRNCAKLLDVSLELRKNELWGMAQQMILKNLNNLLNGEDCVEWSWRVWRTILPKLGGEQLVKAFKALKRWRDHDPSKREETFHRLGKYVRYRSFGSSAAADTLEGTGILSPAEMVSLFMHFAGGQKTVSVSPRDDLQRHLDTVASGFRICLTPGSYEGDFTLAKLGVKIIGKGPDTVIQGRLIIEGDEMEIADLKIIGTPRAFSSSSGSALTTATRTGNPIIVVKGSSNVLDNVEISAPNPSSSSPQKPSGKRRKASEATVELDERFSAALIVGNGNKLTNINTNVPCISVVGNSNTVECAQFNLTNEGVIIEGDNNLINDLIFFPSSEAEGGRSAVTVHEGSENTVSHLSFVQVPANTESLMLKLGEKSALTRIRYCASGSVEVKGKKHDLIGVTLSPRFKFTLAGEKHQIVDSAADQFLSAGKGLVITNCEFY